jgi:hypothetical protein
MPVGAEHLERDRRLLDEPLQEGLQVADAVQLLADGLRSFQAASLG